MMLANPKPAINIQAAATGEIHAIVGLYTASFLEPFLPSTHAHLRAMVEVELHLVHELLHEEYASAVFAQQIFLSKWVWKRMWIESRARILDTHE